MSEQQSLSEEQQSSVSPAPTTASSLRRQKREAARLARAQAASKPGVEQSTKMLYVFGGQAGTSIDPNPTSNAGWTEVVRRVKRRDKVTDYN